MKFREKNYIKIKFIREKYDIQILKRENEERERRARDIKDKFQRNKI